MKNLIKKNLTLTLTTSLFLPQITAQVNNNYQPVWTTEPGDTAFGFSGDGINTVINNKCGLKAGFDFDGDGNLEFITSLQSNNEATGRNNILYLFEADGDNNYVLRWSYKINNVPHQRNGLAVGDLDNDNNPEIIWIVDQLTFFLDDNVFIFEYDPGTGNFPDEPTATWNTPRDLQGEFRCEVDLKVSASTVLNFNKRLPIV